MTNPSLEQFRARFPQGTVLMREGEQDSRIFLPESGTLDIYIKGVKVNTIDAGESADFIGEVGAILGAPRSATVVAATDCVVVCLPRFELEAVMKNAPSLGVKLVRSLCKKLSESSAAFAEFQHAGAGITATGDTALSVQNYLKGFIACLEQACEPDTGMTPRQVLDYFIATNPWGICRGDRRMIAPLPQRPAQT